MMVLFAAMAVQAQPFEFQYQGRSLADGATVVIAAEEDAFGELACETNPAANPTNGLVMKLLGSTPVNVKATLEITHNSLGSARVQWCMGGECSMFSSATKLTKQFTLADIQLVQMDASDISATGYLTATLQASVGLEKRSVNIRFNNGDPDAIAQVNRLPLDSRTTVHNLAGQPVNPHRLSKGIYIIGNKKIIIK